jgi:hypothetical protein
MLEANREVKCSTKIQYESEQAALRVPGEMNLSWESTQKYRPVQCGDCGWWHLLHRSETLNDKELVSL